MPDLPNPFSARLLFAASLLAFFGNTAFAQTASAAYPSRPLRIVVPFTPGGSTDILARSIGLELTKVWGQPVIIENVPGAGGSIGADKVARAPADGYTLLMGHIGTLAVNPSLYPALPYDPVKSYAPVAWVARVPNVLAIATPTSPEAFGQLIVQEIALWKSVIQSGRVKAY